MVAFHFPPIQGSSGVQRTLRFAQHLPKYGWRPIILTIVPSAYPKVGADKGNEIPDGLEVHRAFGLDAARRLSLFGKYPKRFGVPDRWTTWRTWAVAKARRIIATRHVDAIWSTFPIATAHDIALSIAQESSIPWIAEFRDPMWQGDYPPDPEVNRAWLELEQRIFARANGAVVTTPSAADIYRTRFPTFPQQQLHLIENGYDEETFARAAASLTTEPVAEGAARRPITILHSGIIYPSERDPTALFRAIANLKARGVVSRTDLRVVLRASGYQEKYSRELTELGIDDIVELAPGIDYLRALQEMLTVDGLLILQASNCNAQVPAKLFEYLRAQKPILALTDPTGDTARTLVAAKVGAIARLDSTSEIESALLTFMQESRTNSWRQASPECIAKYSRASQSHKLACLLNSLMTSDSLS